MMTLLLSYCTSHEDDNHKLNKHPMDCEAQMALKCLFMSTAFGKWFDQ